MKNFKTTLKWIFIGTGIIFVITFLANPSYEFFQSVKSGYLKGVAEHEKLEEQKNWITASQIQYPIEKTKFLNNLDIRKLVKRIHDEDPTSYKFLFEFSKIPMEQGSIRKFHPDVGLLYDTCQQTINSDELLTEIYTYGVSEEILGLNSAMTNMSGIIDSYAEKVGRDYIYSIGDDQIKYLMEGLNRRGAEILRDNLSVSEQKSQENAKFLTPDSEFDKSKMITKKMGHFIIISMCIPVDIKLGLIGTGTNFQIRAQQSADMVQRKIKIEKSEEYEKRRDKLSDTLNRLSN